MISWFTMNECFSVYFDRLLNNYHTSLHRQTILRLINTLCARTTFDIDHCILVRLSHVFHFCFYQIWKVLLLGRSCLFPVYFSFLHILEPLTHQKCNQQQPVASHIPGWERSQKKERRSKRCSNSHHYRFYIFRKTKNIFSYVTEPLFL